MDPELANLVGSIYDAVIDPALWGPAIEDLRRHFGFHLAGLGVTSLPSGRGVLQVSANVPAEYIAAIPRYGEAAMDLWGGVARSAQLPLEEPLVTSQVTPPSQWEQNVFYREWARPLGLIDQVALFLSRDQTMFASLGLGVHETSRPVAEIDMDGLRAIAPHLSRAIIISRILAEATTTATTFRSALDSTASAVVLVNEQMRILYANPVATQMLRGSDPIVEVEGRLTLPTELVHGRLEQAVKLSSLEEGRLERRGIGIPARGRDGSPMVVHVMPLERRALRAGVPLPAVAAVFLGPGVAQPLPIDALALLFELTPAELKVFELTVAGRPTLTIADHLGVAKSTVRSHLLSIFTKTGRHSRAELSQLSREFVRPAW